jgi:hypothetical protein
MTLRRAPQSSPERTCLYCATLVGVSIAQCPYCGGTLPPEAGWAVHSSPAVPLRGQSWTVWLYRSAARLLLS